MVIFAAQTDIAGATLVAVIVLAVIELALVAFCLVDVFRRPAVSGGRKWVWVLVILFFNLVGPIVYLAVGRVSQGLPEDAPGEPVAADGARDRAAAAADVLYGPAAGREGRAEAVPAPPQLSVAPPPSDTPPAPSATPPSSPPAP